MMQTAMNRQAVMELRTLFERLPEEKCDQSHFVCINGELRPIEQRGPDCGAVACAAGWTALTQAPTIEHGMTDLLVERQWALDHGLLDAFLLSVQRGDQFYVDVSIFTIATAALGLNRRTAEILFTGSPALRDDETDRQWVIRQLDTLLTVGDLDQSEVRDSGSVDYDDDDDDDDYADDDDDDETDNDGDEAE